MEQNLRILGNEEEALYYNLNKQFSNQKKVIITKTKILNSFEDIDTKATLLNSINEKENNLEEKSNETQLKLSEKPNFKLRNELYKQITDELSKLSNTYIEVKLNNYNFMNSISNTKYNITLRTNHFSFSEYFIEKGTILSNIKHLFEKYYQFKKRTELKKEFSDFQIEITEAEEIEKHLILKKENNKILLSCGYGFPFQEPFDHHSGEEIYISEGEKYQYFKPEQTEVLIREHNHIKLIEIEPPEKILTNEELIEINKRTKKIEDATIECYFTIKKQLRITHVSINETPLEKFSEEGIILEKSTKNYNKISILSIRDNLNEETINPRYILLKNSADIKQYYENLKITEKIDGIIFTIGHYSKILDYIKNQYNIDILYIKKKIRKSLEEELDLEKITIKTKEEETENPFSTILKEQNKEKDQLLEKLKNLDLDNSENDENYAQKKELFQEVEKAVNQIVGSNESSFNQNNNNKMALNNKKKTALEMLYESALQQANNNNNNQYEKQQTEPEKIDETTIETNNFEKTDTKTALTENHEEIENKNRIPFDNNNNELETSDKEKLQNKEIIEKNNELITKYLNILGTKIITTNNFNNKQVFLKNDENTYNLSPEKEYYKIVFDEQEILNQTENNEEENLELHKIIPINLYRENLKNCYLLIRNINDYFLITEPTKKNISYFINLINIPYEIKENYIKKITTELRNCSIICSKNDISLIKKYIPKIKEIMIDDLQNEEELIKIKNEILETEKRELLKHLNNN